MQNRQPNIKHDPKLQSQYDKMSGEEQREIMQAKSKTAKNRNKSQIKNQNNKDNTGCTVL